MGTSSSDDGNVIKLKSRYPKQDFQWIHILSTVVGAAIMVTVYVFTTFQTKDAAKEEKSSIEKRFDRLDVKLDYLIERSK